MRTTTSIETTVTHELEATDIINLLNGKPPGGLIPEGWQFFSVEVHGLGVSKGMKVTLKRLEAGK